MKYTVILAYPAVCARDGARAWCCGHVDADNPDHAVQVAQRECAQANGMDDPNDLPPLGVFDGELLDLFSDLAIIAKGQGDAAEAAKRLLKGRK